MSEAEKWVAIKAVEHRLFILQQRLERLELLGGTEQDKLEIRKEIADTILANDGAGKIL